MKKIILGISFIVVSLLLMSCATDIVINGSTDTVNLIVGQTHTIDATTLENYSLTYEIMDESVLSIDGQVITALTAGQTTITISVMDHEDIFIEITVNVSALTLSASVDALTLKVGESDQITGTANNGLGVLYTSSDEDVFTVDEDGNIDAVGEGEANLVIASTFDQTVQLNVLVTVRKVISVDANTDAIELFVGEIITTPFVSNDGLVYASALDSIATVDEDGNIPGQATGIVTITSHLNRKILTSFLYQKMA